MISWIYKVYLVKVIQYFFIGVIFNTVVAKWLASQTFSYMKFAVCTIIHTVSLDSGKSYGLWIWQVFSVSLVKIFDRWYQNTHSAPKVFVKKSISYGFVVVTLKSIEWDVTKRVTVSGRSVWIRTGVGSESEVAVGSWIFLYRPPYSAEHTTSIISSVVFLLVPQ